MCMNNVRNDSDGVIGESYHLLGSAEQKQKDTSLPLNTHTHTHLGT